MYDVRLAYRPHKLPFRPHRTGLKVPVRSYYTRPPFGDASYPPRARLLDFRSIGYARAGHGAPSSLPPANRALPSYAAVAAHLRGALQADDRALPGDERALRGGAHPLRRGGGRTGRALRRWHDRPH